MQYHIFVPKQQRKSLQRMKFFLKVDQYGCKKIQNFMLISGLKEYFRKSIPEKARSKQQFFEGLEIL
jgi:hypothetical protein